MKVIIAGSRCFHDVDREWVKLGFSPLEAAHRAVIIERYVNQVIIESKFDVDTVISGGAKGIDLAGENWAVSNDVRFRRMMAKWSINGKKAGILRNIDMGDIADALAFVTYKGSKGTEHMIQYMQKLDKPFYGIYIDQITLQVKTILRREP